MTRLRLVPLMALVLACGACKPRLGPSVPHAACELALQAAKVAESRSERPFVMMFAPTPEELWMYHRDAVAQALKWHPELANDPLQKPFVQMARLADEYRHTSVIEECPALRAWWQKHSVLHDDERIRAYLKSLPPLGYWTGKYTVLSMSVPVFSGVGRFAQMFVTGLVATDVKGPETIERSPDGHWVTDLAPPPRLPAPQAKQP